MLIIHPASWNQIVKQARAYAAGRRRDHILEEMHGRMAAS